MPVRKTKTTRKAVKKKTTSKGIIRKPKQRAAKVKVVKADYLNHYISPHLINLKEFAPQKPDFSIKSESVESYFEPAIAEDQIFQISSVEQEEIKEAVVENVIEDEIKQKIDQIRREIEQIEEVQQEEELVRSAEEEEKLVLPEIKPVREKLVALAVERASFNPVILTKKIVVYFDSEVNRLVQPLRDLPLSFRTKAIIGFLIIALLLILPLSGITYYKQLKGTASGVLSSAQAAVSHLSQAGGAITADDLKTADSQFYSAYQNFSSAQQELEKVNKFITTLASLIPRTDKTLETAEAILKIGQNLSEVGSHLTVALVALEDDSKTLTDKVVSLQENLIISQPLIREVNSLVTKIDVDQLPAAQQAQFLHLQYQIPIINQSFDNFVALTDLAREILGNNELKRYLVLFQNNHEIRPTGGFIGSFALLDLVDGEIKNLEIPGGGSYDLQGSLKISVAAPRPLQLINPRWEFQDSNWFSDWPTAAQKIIWFYNKAGGPTVDGVIAINASLLQEMLGVIEPIKVANKEITAANFFDVTQKAVELEYDQEKNKPKEFIGKMAPIILEKIFSGDKEELISLISLFNQALNSKDLQLYFTDQAVQKKLADLSWVNQIKGTSGDYLMVINTNIAGEKTDGVIEQNILHQAQILADGRVIDEITIVREHNGVPGELFYGVRNVNYLRLYVPLGSELIAASGFQDPPAELFNQVKSQYQQDEDLLRISGLTQSDEKTGVKINQEFGKTVFAGWTQTDPGERSIITFKYQLPFKVSFAKYQTDWGWLNRLEEKLKLAEPTTNYSLVVQKQSGADSIFYSLVDFPEDWQKVWQYPNDLQISSGNLNFADYLDRDKIYSVMFKK